MKLSKVCEYKGINYRIDMSALYKIDKNDNVLHSVEYKFTATMNISVDMDIVVMAYDIKEGYEKITKLVRELIEKRLEDVGILESIVFVK